MTRLVVIGNGMVGHRLVEAVRRRDPGRAIEITVLAEEHRPAYDRVRLTSWFDGEDLALPPVEDVDVRLGLPARSIDLAARKVHTDTGAHEYDELVIATGSYAFVPPVPGKDLPGCFVYRTIDDLAELQEYAEGRSVLGSVDTVVGAVVGGGLLGLEAANALHRMGVTTHVVEFASRLMPLQVDDAGGAMLRRHVEDLGLTVHTDRAAARITGDANVRQVVFADGGVLHADVVVFAAGVRPRDDLARDAGLAVGPRGGIVVDSTCRTSEPNVWAIGECALIDGRVYGLVAPGYSMAETVAARITGEPATFPGADTSTKLKLLGVDVASFGEISGPLDVTFVDPATRVYAKLVLSDDATTLLGGVLVGDASAYPALRAALGGPLPGPPLALLAPAGATGSTDGLAGDAQVCSCNAVTKSAILTAITDQGCCDIAGIKACTRAGTTCGSCVPLLKQLLAEAGVAASKALCEHFDLGRRDLADVIRVRGIRTFSELIASHGRGRGCDICKPTIASILASTYGGYILDGEQAALQDTNDAYLANIQRDGTYSVVPRIPGGEITPDKLIAIGEVARDFGLYTKITGGQRIDLLGVRVEQLPRVWQRLVDAGFESGHAYGKAVRTVKSCVGSTWCRYGVQDSVGLAIALELRYRGLRSPHKLKGGVSGCARECAEARGKDFGIIATEQGWNLYVGGNGGFKPRHAELFATDLTTEELVTTVDRFLMYYIRTADRLQRTAVWIEGMDGGLDHLRDVIITDTLGIAGELDAEMSRHISGYTDEWRATLDDPDRLSRFVSFVNAPGTPDPSITFEPERGQLVPAGGRREPVLLGMPR
jgi:nitrite reductase (NADH) large subunit